MILSLSTLSIGIFQSTLQSSDEQAQINRRLQYLTEVKERSQRHFREVLSMKPTIFLITLFSSLGMNGFAAQPLTPDEQTFVKKAATSDQAEIKFAQFALEHATTAAVKQFAQQMVTDHTKSTSMLKPIAGEHQVVLPDKPGPDTNEDFQRLEKVSGIAFDKTYIEIMVKDHETMVDTFQAEAAKVTDPQLKDFIANVEPVVAHHLAMAKAIRQDEKTAS